MVVVLAAALAYKYHCSSTSGEGQEITEIERQLSQQWQKTESFRKSSSEILQSALSSCAGGGDSSSSTSVNHYHHCKQQQQQEEEESEQVYSYTTNNNNNNNMTNSNITPSDEQESIIVHQVEEQIVRNDWINAVFGEDFFTTPLYQAPRQGVGMAHIPHYTAYTATIIVPPQQQQGDKVGMTLSNIAIGLYVKHVEPSSEAFVAGIQEGSILVKINDALGMLAEPTKQALERIWQYEGIFDSSSSTPVMKLTFYKNGKLYDVIMLVTSAPWGIVWASCGQFPLVQRSYSFAAQAGVRRGSLVANINSTCMRSMNHQVAANVIADLVQSQQEIHMTLVFPPAAARTSYTEKPTFRNKNTTAVNKRTTQDGVEVRVHPLAYSIGTLFQKDAKSSPPTTKQPQVVGKVSQLASQVAAGTLEAPSGRRIKAATNNNTSSMLLPKKQSEHDYDDDDDNKTYPPCPPLANLVTQWNAWNALAYLFQFQSSLFQNVVASFPNNDNSMAQNYVLEKMSNYQALIVLACLSVVCEYSCQPLMARLLDQAELDQEFGQGLYFLLLAYIATLESQTRVDGDMIEMLQAAILELTDRMQSNTTSIVVVVVEVPTMTPTPPYSPSTKVNGIVDEEDTAGVESSSSPTTEAVGTLQHQKKKKGFRVFRKKSKSSLGKEKSPKSKSPKNKSPPPIQEEQRPTLPSSAALVETTTTTRISLATMFDNRTRFLQELDTMCDTVERSLLKSISQKIADWALQPWSLSKQKALVAVTEAMRESLFRGEHLPIVNPIECTEVLTSVDPNECYILPSAHFPLLLTFNVVDKDTSSSSSLLLNQERLYRTKVEVVSLRGTKMSPVKMRRGSKGSGGMPSMTSSRAFFVQGAVAGVVKESGRSTRIDAETSSHSWEKGSLLTFDTRSSWGAPQTLSLRLSSADMSEDGRDQLTHTDDSGTLHYSSEVGFCWVDLRPMWTRIETSKSTFTTVMCHAQICPSDAIQTFDEHGDLITDSMPERFEIELRVTTEMLPFHNAASGFQTRKRMLLYKHDDDLRQEMFAIEFIKTCDALLKASGLVLNLLTFRCIPVGARQGFIEWVPGSVPLSDICKPADDVPLSRNVSTEGEADKIEQNHSIISEVTRAGLTKHQSLYRMEPSQITAERGNVSNNPIQDFLRSAAYDPDAPYLIRKEVMDTYVKSCAGYCIITYVLGVGDRHLDNLLLHQTGHFFHCDFSFILGDDPKKYLPVRITEDMVFGMGGKESDNYAMFLSLMGAAFLALRRHENVRVVLSLVRLMVGNKELSIHANPDEAVLKMRERLCLNLSDTEAVSYIEDLVETSISSKLWMAVDAIHSLGKRF